MVIQKQTGTDSQIDANRIRQSDRSKQEQMVRQKQTGTNGKMETNRNRQSDKNKQEEMVRQKQTVTDGQIETDNLTTSEKLFCSADAIDTEAGRQINQDNQDRKRQIAALRKTEKRKKNTWIDEQINL